MDRLEKMRITMKECFEQNIDLSIKETDVYIQENLEKIINRIAEDVNSFLQNVVTKKNKIAICYLYSSVLDESDELCLLAFDIDPFIDGIDNMIYVNIPELFHFAKEKIPYLEQELHNHFIRILSYEKEEVKREYMYKYTNQIKGFIYLIFKNCIFNMPIFVGPYMGELEEI
ncbi:MAG: hypothetical protein NC118_03550 [Eubacterium sp.]|nr:hypothetical protein [Eubacterium sp.]